MNRILRLAIFTSLFVVGAAPACANEFTFSQAAVGPIMGLFILWFLVGLVLFFCRLKPMFLGVGSLLAIGLCIFLGGHLEVGIMIWMIYVALAAVYCARPRERLDNKTRRVNLVYHGTFLVLMIVCGATAKYLYWSQMGGFATWLARAPEILRAFIPVGVIASLCCIGWFGWRHPW